MPSGLAATEASFEGVVNAHSGLIARIALTHEADAGLREDLKQEILLAIWRALPAFRGQSSIKTFVASIAQKRAITHVSRYARIPRSNELNIEMPASGSLPDEDAMARDKHRRLLAALRALSLPQRETATLLLEGFSFAEIADTLGITQNAAMLRCQRAKAALSDLMRVSDG